MIKKEVLKNVMRDFHLGELPKMKPRDLKAPVNTGKIITLSGVRRSGKTFILLETIKGLLTRKVEKEKILYINFEDERLELVTEELDYILEGYRELYPDFDLRDCYFFFDEIQNVEGWEKFVRRVYDTVSKNIFITGSNSKLLSKEIATSLRGRTLTYEVFPLSFIESLGFMDISTDLYHSKNRAKIIHFFERYLVEGGFPEIVELKDKSLKDKVLQEYFDVMLYRDLIERYSITNIPVLKYFLKRVFESITSPLSVNKIFNELKSQGYKVGKNSLYEYLDEGVSIYLMLTAKKYSESSLKQELGDKKFYAIDNGLLNAITFKFSKDYGKLLENLMFLEIVKSFPHTFFYKGKKECDFVVFKQGEVKFVLQVCYSIGNEETKTREITGLVEACNRLNCLGGFIITMAEQEEVNVEGISVKIVPAYRFLISYL